MNKNLVTLVIFFCMATNHLIGQTMSKTFTVGDLPTAEAVLNAACPGENASLIFDLPYTENTTITNVHIAYNMTAASGGWKSDQRSFIMLSHPGGFISETEISGTGNTEGTQIYSRNTSVFNGAYGANAQLKFYMFAWRTYGAGGCHSINNKVNNNTWTITITYTVGAQTPKVGVNTNDPKQVLSVNGKLNISNDGVAPFPGSMRFVNNDFEGYDGQVWQSFTRGNLNNSQTTGNYHIEEDDAITNIEGPSDDQYFGDIMDCKLNNFVVGCPDCVPANVYVYNVQNDLIGPQIITHPSTSINFGCSVAIKPLELFIGASQEAVGGVTSGAVYHYTQGAAGFTYANVISPPDGLPGDRFGSKIAVSDNYLAVCAYNRSVGGVPSAGRIYIYKKNGSTWTYHQSFSAPIPQSEASFGFSLAINDRFLIIGEPERNISEGKAYYSVLLGQTWSDLTPLSYPSGATEYFGVGITMYGDLIAVSATYYATEGVANSGRVAIFKFENNAFALKHLIPNPKPLEFDNFGRSVFLNSKSLYIGCPNKKIKGKLEHGITYEYDITPNTVRLKGQILPSDGNIYDGFGSTVVGSNSKLMISSPYKNVETFMRAGKVYLYDVK